MGSIFPLEYRRRRILRCSHNLTSTQLVQRGSPVITRWYLQTPDTPTVQSFVTAIMSQAGMTTERHGHH